MLPKKVIKMKTSHIEYLYFMLCDQMHCVNDPIIGLKN